MGIRGKKIRRLRRRLEMSQAELAKKVGLTQPAIHHIESGKKGTSIGTLTKLAHALHVEETELLW